MFTAFQLGITPKRPSSQSALSPNLHFYIFSYLAKANWMQIEMVLKKMIRGMVAVCCLAPPHMARNVNFLCKVRLHVGNIKEMDAWPTAFSSFE